MRITVLIAIIAILTSCATSKEGGAKKKTGSIQTNAQCGDCKDRIGDVLNYEKGIIYANLDLDTKIVEVKYNTRSTTLAKIKQTIAEIGYDADEVKAVESAQKALPACCQPGGHD
ncbi:hypothetical protein CW751_06055 [Brumimicrobium salinarum]|uniref:HMA domain-containing protein n=1 Tax=Brumimicrobium salinarum TaxID=2058658 RepID=A0A2I0R3J1_9FLAO|nr:heavy-metal-associated domain-containing protein [Brumimicrobium salinarum]PKR81144.1 hypothetical protein CW751_06055 [Brumimicrobium salinarum]